MVALIFLCLNLVTSLFKSKSRLEAENAARRRQLIILAGAVHHITSRNQHGHAQYRTDSFTGRNDRPFLLGRIPF
jgi:hypothetical protein